MSIYWLSFICLFLCDPEPYLIFFFWFYAICSMRDMDKDYTGEEIQEVMDVVDLTGSGDISYDEFCKVFIANIKTSASI